MEGDRTEAHLWGAELFEEVRDAIARMNLLIADRRPSTETAHPSVWMSQAAESFDQMMQRHGFLGSHAHTGPSSDMKEGTPLEPQSLLVVHDHRCQRLTGSSEDPYASLMSTLLLRVTLKDVSDSLSSLARLVEAEGDSTNPRNHKVTPHGMMRRRCCVLVRDVRTSWSIKPRKLVRLGNHCHDSDDDDETSDHSYGSDDDEVPVTCSQSGAQHEEKESEAVGKETWRSHPQGAGSPGSGMSDVASRAKADFDIAFPPESCTPSEKSIREYRKQLAHLSIGDAGHRPQMGDVCDVVTQTIKEELAAAAAHPDGSDKRPENCYCPVHTCCQCKPTSQALADQEKESPTLATDKESVGNFAEDGGSQTQSLAESRSPQH